jgi:hypothetical protein
MLELGHRRGWLHWSSAMDMSYATCRWSPGKVVSLVWGVGPHLLHRPAEHLRPALLGCIYASLLPGRSPWPSRVAALELGHWRGCRCWSLATGGAGCTGARPSKGMETTDASTGGGWLGQRYCHPLRHHPWHMEGEITAIVGTSDADGPPGWRRRCGGRSAIGRWRRGVASASGS